MIESAPCGYITLHASGRVDHVNRTFLEWSGHAADQMVGKRFSDFLTMPGRIYYETHIAPLLRMQGFFNEFAIDMLTASGDPLQIIANANERRDPDGKLLLIRLALIKATDRRRYEQELLAARELSIAAEKATQEVLRLEHETSELREQFIAVLGHDLRNPLASISAGTRILDRTVQSEKEHEVIAMMQTTVMRMASMIDNVLDFARGRLGGGITLEREAGMPLEPVLAQVIDELRLASPGRVIEAEFEIDRPVDCDRTRIGQLLSNLLGNALTHGAADKPVAVHADTAEGLFTLWVANAGEPISQSAMDKLFEPFFRGKARASRQGLGLGLYIASQIAKAHGGTLTVASSPEKTRFTDADRLAGLRQRPPLAIHRRPVGLRPPPSTTARRGSPLIPGTICGVFYQVPVEVRGPRPSTGPRPPRASLAASMARCASASAFCSPADLASLTARRAAIRSSTSAVFRSGSNSGGPIAIVCHGRRRPSGVTGVF